MAGGETIESYPILLVEDEPVTAALLEKALSKAGHRVTVAQNGREALELLKQRFYPFVLTDWEMPELNGLDLCRAIRNSSNNSYCYIVILTAKEAREDIVAGLEAGADDFLTKSPSHGELLARVKAGMRILRLERSLIKAKEEIRSLSITDSLTGCYNRAYIEEHLPKELERAKRYRRNLSVLFCDLDHFKQVNDSFGHQRGDCVLRELVQCINGSIRQHMDWLARYGGEEFLIVAPETDVQGASHMAERIRKSIFDLEIEANKEKLRVTASFGVTGISPSTDEAKISVKALIEQADRELYRAKMDGRNRVSAKKL
jgi:two-component system cell cycle response regulator